MSQWSIERIAVLRRLWADGKTGSEIGLAVDMSRDAVIGKAKRLRLTVRPSPIILGGRSPKKYARKKSTEPKKPRKSRAKPKLRLIAGRQGPIRACAWLEGKRFNYIACGAPTLPGDPYCEVHHRLCYTAMPKATGRPFEFPK